MLHASLSLLGLVALLASCNASPTRDDSGPTPAFDLILRGGTVYDGSGQPGVRADVGVRGDRVAAVGDLSAAVAEREVDASGLAVAPGFINVLSWATRSLGADPRALSDVKQGVTLEVFGEGWSEGPLSDAMLETRRGGDGKVATWRSLGGYLDHLEERGVGVNVASFVGATTLRIHEIGYEDRAPTAEELARMQDLARAAMREGALGLGSSLIYAPAFYAKTDELVALAQAVGEFGGMYISHIRSEGNAFLEALDELIHIARAAGVPAEVYHLKAAGADNWHKLEAAIEKIEAARASGLRITADIYTYTAGSTGLDAAMPPWVQAGGYGRWRSRLKQPDIRTRVAEEMRTPTDAWENLYLAAGGAENVLLVGFRNADLQPLTGRTLASVATERGLSPEETAMDLVIEDGSRVDCVYFLMSEPNVERKIGLPWVSFCSDSSSPAPEGDFLKSSAHPRAYGSFARLLGRYVRDRGVIPLHEAIHRMTGLPAANFGIEHRGQIAAGAFADLVVFDPATIADRATYEKPHQLATGVHHVWVNGEQVLRDGEHTGALPGRAVRGPGWTGRAR